MDHKLSVSIKNDLAEIAQVTQFFEQFQEFHNLSAKVGYAIQLALDEVLTNIISYGYEDDKIHYIQIAIYLSEQEIVLLIKDDGRKFNPLKDYQVEVDTESSLEDRPIGGMGLHLVKNLMDHIQYEYIEDHNSLLMKKSLN